MTSSRHHRLSRALVACVLSAASAFGFVGMESEVVHAACNPAVYVGFNSVGAYNTSTYSVIDLNGASAGNTISLGNSAYDMDVSPDGSKLVISNTTNNVVIIDTATNTSSTIAVGGITWGVAINSTSTVAYVSDYTNGQIEVINLTNNTLTTSVSLGNVNSSEIALTPDGTQVWVRFNYVEGIAILDTATNTLIDANPSVAGTQYFFAGSTTSTISMGQGLSFSPDGTRAVATNFFAGTISLIDVTNMTLIDVNGANAGLNTLTTGNQSVRRALYSPDGNRIFVLHTPFSGSSSYVRVFTADMSSYTDITEVNYPNDLTFLPSGRFAVTNYSGNSVSFFSASGSGNATWGGTFTREDTNSGTTGVQDLTFSSAYVLEYGCASSLATPSTTTTTTAAPTTTTTAAPTTTTATTAPATTSTTVASSSTTAPSVSTSVAPSSNSTTTVATGSTTTTVASASSTSTTAVSTSSTAASTTTTLDPDIAIQDFIGATVEDVDDLANVAESKGGAAVFVNGKAIEVEVSTSLSSITLAHKTASLTVDCFNSKGESIALSADSRFELRSGDVIRVSFSGFTPQKKVNVAVFSDPVALGSVSPDANGAGNGEWIVPDSIPAGTHTLIVAGDLPKLENTMFGLRIVVDQESLVSRIASSWVTRIVLALGVLGGLLLPATLRRRKEEDDSPVTA